MRTTVSRISGGVEPGIESSISFLCSASMIFQMGGTRVVVELKRGDPGQVHVVAYLEPRNDSSS